MTWRARVGFMNFIYLMPLLVLLILAIVVLGLRYLFLRVRNLVLHGKEKVTKEDKIRASVIAAAPILLIVVLCIVSPYFWVIPVLHLFMFWGLLEIILGIVNLILVRRHKSAKAEKFADIFRKRRIYSFIFSSLLAVILTVTYLSIAFFLAHYLYETDYTVTTDRTPMKIAFIADTHIGSSFGSEEFAEYVEKIGEQDPDIMVIVGDYVDEHTKRDDMIRCCQALGNIKTTYGVFYVPGNHDDSNNKLRGFTYAELLDALRDNGVTVLEDEVSYINDEYCIIGRKDKSMERLSMEELMKDVDPSYYTILLDHQPNDYDAEEKAGCDLVLAGHTHGGHMLPIGQIAEIIGINDATYGLEKRGGTTFIVTSGMSNWAIAFRSGTISEYCFVDLVNE